MNAALKLAGFYVLGSLLIAQSDAHAATTDLPVNWQKFVVRIEKEDRKQDGSVDTVSLGTGFLCRDEGRGFFLISNRHILSGRDRIFIRYNRATTASDKRRIWYRQQYSLLATDSIALWKGHPDRSVDIAALRIHKPDVEVDAIFIRYERFKGFDSLEVGEDVFFFGYPMSVEGHSGMGDFPILRSGVVAYKAYQPTTIEGQPLDSTMFLIDGFSFGGNSGSPVLTRVRGSSKAALVGIVSGHVAHYEHIPIRDFLTEKTGDTVFISIRPGTASFKENAGLAKAWSIDRVKETLAQFDASPSNKR